MTFDACKNIHNQIVLKDDWIGAGNMVLTMLGKPASVASKAQAISVCRGLFQFLLDNDLYLHAATLQWGSDVFNAEPESVSRSFDAIHKGNMLMVMGGSSLGKCLGKDTPVLMLDGTRKMVQDVKVGDVLMGDDGKPRNVLVVSAGKSELFRITPERGDPWVCNDEHILSLRVSCDKMCGIGKYKSNRYFKGNVLDIPIKEYLSYCPSRKNILKQFHVGVEFPEKPLEFDPYIYGSWIGDGGTDVPALHTPDGPMAKRWVEYFESKGFRVFVGYKEKACQMFCARRGDGHSKHNPFSSFIKTSVRGDKEKFIRDEYLINSKENRMKLLAGLIDSDGWVSSKTSYGFTSKFESLARQVAWLAKSLGYAASVTSKVNGIKSIGFSAVYWSVQISGPGITKIPTLEKHAVESTTVKNLLNAGISVESIGVGDYYGFVIDGNHRFLLGDFTVTHNTYGIGAWMLLDYLRDPIYTTVKLAAVSEDHLRKNLFAHLANLYRNCAIPCGHDIQIRDSDLWMGVKEAGYEFGVSGIAFKQSQETSGQFKGHKFKPVRKTPHPKFGYFSRLRVLGDEVQNWPGGPFQDFNTLIASMDGPDKIKIALAFNPENTSCHAVRMSEPEQGWQVEDIEILYDWQSKAGWTVCRLDAARCENIIQKKVVYPGLQTYVGFLSYLKAGGDSSAAYMCFARGWPPMKGAVNIIIPPAWPQSQRGEATFIENPITLASVDLAFTGQDTAKMAVGRWGLASGWRDHMGKWTEFVDRTNVTVKRPRHVLQIDQILPMQKHDDTVKMSEEIIGRAKMLGISPEWLAVDQTGYGFGVASHLKKVWGSIFGIGWAEKATEAKIVSEDIAGAHEQCSGVMSEMWWAFRRWLDPVCSAILINPIIPPQPINTQLTSRRYRNGKSGRITVESKEEYKARNQHSPDEADAMIMLVHLVRRKSDVLPGLVEQSEPKRESEGGIKFQTFSPIRPFESDDSMSGEGSDADHLEDVNS